MNVGFSSPQSQERLTRQRKLRDVMVDNFRMPEEDDGDRSKPLPGSPNPESRSSHRLPQHRSLYAVPQPLPLPNDEFWFPAEAYRPTSQTPYLKLHLLNNKSSPEWTKSSNPNVHLLPLPPGVSRPVSSRRSLDKSDGQSTKGQWQNGKLLGRGTYGSVYEANNRETGSLCALKEVDVIPDDTKSSECIRQLEQEIKILRNLEHPNIVQYLGSEVVEDKFCIYLEHVHPGSISKYIRERGGAVAESVVRNFTRHILSGLAYLHSNKTVHSFLHM